MVCDVPNSSSEILNSLDELASVQHLIELCYDDPQAAAAQQRREAQESEEALKRAQALIEAGKHLDAIDLLNQLAARTHASPQPRWQLARAYFQTGEVDAAASALEWLQWHGFEHAEFAVLRGMIALRRREFQEAIDHAEYASCLRHPLPAAELILGEALFRIGKLEAAGAVYRRALPVDEQNAAAFAGLAAVSLRSGAFEEAVDLALRALEQNIQLPATHYRLGLALIHLGRQGEAIAALEAAARMAPQLAGPHRWLARVHEAAGSASAAEHRKLGRQIVARRRSRRLAAGGVTAAGT